MDNELVIFFLDEVRQDFDSDNVCGKSPTCNILPYCLLYVCSVLLYIL